MHGSSMPLALADIPSAEGTSAYGCDTTKASTSAPSKRQKVLADGAAPVDHAALFSREGQERRMARLRIITTTFVGREGVVGLHGGLPPATAFPIVEMSLKLRDGSCIVIDDPAKACLMHHFCAPVSCRMGSLDKQTLYTLLYEAVMMYELTRTSEGHLLLTAVLACAFLKCCALAGSPLTRGALFGACSVLCASTGVGKCCQALWANADTSS